MSILASNQFTEVIQLVSKQIKQVHWNYVAKIVTPKGDVECYKVIRKDILRDFQNAYTDSGLLEVLIPLNVYTSSVLPYRDDLKVMLTKIQRSEHPMMDVPSPKTLTTHYKAILTDVKDESFGDTQKTPDGHTMDAVRQFKLVSMQIIDVASDLLSKQTIGGIFANQIPGEVLKGLLGESAKKTNMQTSLSIKGVDMVEPNMQENKLQYVIPDNTPIIELPQLIQSQWFGIYNNGIGSYLFARNWYVYPLFDSSRYMREKRRLTLHVIPPNQMPRSPRTYTVQNGEIIAITTSEVNHQDNANVLNMNKGNAITIQNPEAIVAGENYKAKDGKIEASPNTTQSTFSLSERADKTNVAPNNTVVETVNVANVMSELSGREGSIMTVIWESANDELIIPAMPVKLIFAREGKIQELVGTVLKHQSFTTIQGEVLNSMRYDTKVVLGLFMNESPSNLAGR